MSDSAGWTRIQELESQLALVREQFSRVRAGLVAVEPLLNKPYPDDPRWTPWARFVAPRLRMLDAALRGEELNELAALWVTGAEMEAAACDQCGEPAGHHLVSCPLVGY